MHRAGAQNRVFSDPVAGSKRHQTTSLSYGECVRHVCRFPSETYDTVLVEGAVKLKVFRWLHRWVIASGMLPCRSARPVGRARAFFHWLKGRSEAGKIVSVYMAERKKEDTFFVFGDSASTSMVSVGMFHLRPGYCVFWVIKLRLFKALGFLSCRKRL